MSSTTSILFNGGTEHALASGDPSGLKKEYTDSFSWFCWTYSTNTAVMNLISKFDFGLGRGISFYKEATTNQFTVYIANSGSNRIIVTSVTGYATNITAAVLLLALLYMLMVPQ